MYIQMSRVRQCLPVGSGPKIFFLITTKNSNLITNTNIGPDFPSRAFFMSKGENA